MLGLLTSLRLRLRALFNRQHDRELREELECHIEQLAEQNRAAGLGQDGARAAAHRQLGNLTRLQEQSHDLFGFRSFEDLGQDLRYSVRGLAKSRAFTAVAVISLALGIGVNASVFSVVDAMLLRALPYDEPDRLVRIGLIDPNRNPNFNFPLAPSGAQYLSWKQGTDIFEEMAADFSGGLTDVSSKGHPSAFLKSGFVSAGVFPMLGVAPILGRGFLPDDERLGAADVVILSHSVWQQLFGAEATVIGQTLWVAGDNRDSRVGDEPGGPATIVGVMPAGFNFGPWRGTTELWRPLRLTPNDDRGVRVTARLGPDIPFEQAQAAMETRFTPDADQEGWSVAVQSLQELSTRRLRPTLLGLWAAVGSSCSSPAPMWRV